LSIERLIEQFGVALYLWKPVMTVAPDASAVRTYGRVTELGKCFIQPNGQSQDVFEGRMNSRTAATIYISGNINIEIDDELYEDVPDFESAARWRVVGRTNPAEIGRGTGFARHLNLTVIDAVQVSPSILILGVDP
jgi:hypothetical protein